jgi:ABC-type nitrate/sulfonate/bicarbonate transport system substrate-binding protein
VSQTISARKIAGIVSWADALTRGLCRPLRLCASLMLLMVAQVGGMSHALAAEPLRLAVSLTPLALPIFVAEQQGYFSAEGLTLKINEVIGGHRSLQLVLDGAADLATCSEAVVMFNSFQRRDFAVIATFVTSDDDVKLITRGDISQPRQLAGKRVATVVGAASHYYLDTLLLLNGVDPKSVQVANLQPEAMADALKQGKVDAFAIWEPYPFKALASVPGSRVLLPKSGAYMETFNLVAHAKLRGVRDGELVKLLRALDRAQEFIRSEPRQAQAILRNRLHVDQSFIDWIWPRYNYRLTLAQSLITTLEGEARWAREEGHVTARHSPNFLDFIHSAPLRAARPTAVSIDE